MIELRCKCPSPQSVPAGLVGESVTCPDCRQVWHIVSAEFLDDGGGAGDFDAALIAMAQTPDAGTRYLLGGIVDIQIGKLPTCQIVLGGTVISRQHCRLVRIDFGPSRWKIVDNNSRNGIHVNGRRVTEQELKNGDVVQIGESVFRYVVTQPSPLAPPIAAVGATSSGEARADSSAVLPRQSDIIASGGPRCASCDKTLAAGAKICVDCGIHVATGRPLLTSIVGDNNQLYETSSTWIRLISYLIWLTPMPIPLRSEAYGEHKPYAIWTIAILTTIVSTLFFLSAASTPASSEAGIPGSEFMLWSPWARQLQTVGDLNNDRIHQLVQDMSDDKKKSLHDAIDPEHTMPEDEAVREYLQVLVESRRGEFHWYQLITHAFLHDTSSIFGFALHLGGNMLFLMVFGTRVNSLIGNLATAVLYPILAIAAALVYLVVTGADATGPMLGASGAIMGLAGMYLILFPVHRLICAMWIRVGFLIRSYLGYKIFPMRGFWFLLIYFGSDVIQSMIAPAGGGGVAHWAHIGGFAVGALIGLAIIMSRQFDTNGGDLLSVVLGKHAWPLIGKPSQWILHRQTAGMLANRGIGPA